MGILRGALNGFGKGLEKKAAFDWEKMKSDADIAARERLAEIDRTFRTDLQAKSDVTADARLDKQLKASAAEGSADREFRASEGEANRASEERRAATYAAARGAAGTNADDFTIRDIPMGQNPDGSERKVPWLINGDGTPLMSFEEYQRGMADINKPPPAPAATAEAAPSGGLLQQVQQAAKPGPRDLGQTAPSRAAAIVEANKPKPTPTYGSRASAQQRNQ